MKSSIAHKVKEAKSGANGRNGRRNNSKSLDRIFKLFGSVPDTAEDEKIIQEIYRSRSNLGRIPD